MNSIPNEIQRPTPYGVMATVSLLPGRDPDDDSAWAMDGENTALMGGIYDPSDRRRVADALRRGELTSVEDLFRFGAQKVPKEPLTVPAEFVYHLLPGNDVDGLTTDANVSIQGCADQWATMLADRALWCNRAAVLLELLGWQMKEVPHVNDVTAGITMSMMLTSVLESLGESEVYCLEQAAFYMLSQHAGWRAAGRRWLMPFRKTWFADWIKDRPDYRRLAKLMAGIHDDVPTWAQKVTR